MNTESENYKELIILLSQLSSYTVNNLQKINKDSLTQANNAIIYFSSNNYNKNLSKFFCSGDNSTKYINNELVIRNLTDNLTESYSKVFSKYTYSNKFIKSMAELQSTIAVFNSLYKTDMLESIAKAYSEYDFSGCISAIQKVVNSGNIGMSDYSFLKQSPLFTNLQTDLSLPAGFNTDIRIFNIRSAKRLEHSTNIYFDSNERCFKYKNYSVNVKEMNSICLAANLFDSIGDSEYFSENELVEFMSFLEDSPSMWKDNATGVKIHNLINGANAWIIKESDCYFHSRPREKKICPYTWPQLLKVPYGFSTAGRYNLPGQSRFYFCSNQKGSVNEIKKHINSSEAKNYVVQTVKISTNRELSIFDLTKTNRSGFKTFFKYITYPYDSKSGNRPREYLIPQFVAECCFARGVDAIKYYGDKEYNNYVSKKDDMFDFVSNVGDTAL